MKHILIDSSAILHPLKYITKGINDLDTITVGFFRKVLFLARNFGTSNLIFTWEGTKSGFTPYRKQLYPLYKKKLDKDGNVIVEEKTDKEKEFDKACFKRFEDIRVLVEKLGFKNSFSQLGTEADDIIAKICSEYPNDYFTVCTNDEDMFDVLKYNNSSVYMITKRDFISKTKFIKEKNIDPSLWWKVKSIGGCSSDCVPSPKGVAEATAIKFINGELKENSKKYQSIVDYPKELKIRNKRLVTIPIPQTKSVTLINEKPTFDNFMQSCYELGLEIFINEMYNDWKAFFEIKETLSNKELRDRALERRKNA